MEALVAKALGLYLESQTRELSVGAKERVIRDLEGMLSEWQRREQRGEE